MIGRGILRILKSIARVEARAEDLAAIDGWLEKQNLEDYISPEEESTVQFVSGYNACVHYVLWKLHPEKAIISPNPTNTNERN